MRAQVMGMTNQRSGRGIVVWICSFIEPDLLDNSVPFDNTTPIYLTNLLWKSRTSEPQPTPTDPSSLVTTAHIMQTVRANLLSE